MAMSMAVSSKISFLLILLTLLSSHQIHARDSQFFNKIPSNNNVAAYQIQPKQEEDPLDKLEQEPNFIPQNSQNAAYGLYGQESAQLPASTNLPYKNKNEVEPNEFLPKYLPKNYNTEAYVTEPEGYHPAQETNTNNYYQGYNPAAQETNTNNNYYPSYHNKNQGQGYPASTTATNYYQNYEGTDNNNHNSQQQQQGVNQYNLGQKSYTTSGAGEEDFNNNNVAANKQGMSDTRFLENGKYFYDVNLEKNTNRYPFVSTKRFGDQYRKYGGYYGNDNEINSNDFNNNNDGSESKGEQYQDLQEDNEGLP